VQSAYLPDHCRLTDQSTQPIQRITRYELLFRDLSKYTPSCDDPSSHAILDDVLYQLSETCHNVNEAKDSPEKLRLMENSWLLHDRLHFQDKVSVIKLQAWTITKQYRCLVRRYFKALAAWSFAVLSSPHIEAEVKSRDAI